MSLHFQRTIQQALQNIGQHTYHQLLISEEKRAADNFPGLIEHYGKKKWEIVDLLNEKYSQVLQDKFDLYNWLNFDENDEVAYFLNEAGSNAINYSDHKIPYKFHLWLGEKGFIIGVEQLGRGFNAVEINKKRSKENEGAAFDFFRKCKSSIFFDDPEEARMVLMESLFTPGADRFRV